MANRQFKSLTQTLLENSAFDRESNTLFVTNPGISYDTLKGLAKRHGFAIGKTKNSGFVSIPLSDKYNCRNEDAVNLYDAFMDTFTYFSKNYNTLLAAYKTFDLMDENQAEVGLILDTYATEVLSQGFINNPIKISISDKKVEKLIEKILYKNKIYQRLPNIVRSIAKYGNYGMVLSYPYLEKWLQTDKNADFKQIDVLEDLNIRCVNPKNFKVNTDEFMNVINYETVEETTYTVKPQNTVNKVWQPWQFVHFLIDDELTEPYGKSMLWSMRSAFDQLSTLEGLLGISRASKIQRLVFYVPLPNEIGLSDAYGYINEFKSQYLNSMFSDVYGIKSGRKIPGATSILALPMAADGKKVEMDKIEANIDLSSTEDVDYFKNKIYNNSKLSKGYITGDDVITTAQTLEAQDLKLKRALIPLKKALVNGMMNLVENIIAHLGYDINKLEVQVDLNEPIQISADVITKYGDIAELVGGFKELNPQMTKINQFQILIKLGMPVDLAQLICSGVSVNCSDNDEDIAKFLKNQIVKTPGTITDTEDNNDIFGESTRCSISLTSKRFLAENLYLQSRLDYFNTTCRITQDRSLKESLLDCKKISVETKK